MEDSNNINKSNLHSSFRFVPFRSRNPRPSFRPRNSPPPFPFPRVLATARFLRTLNPVADCDPTRNDRNSQITLRARSLNKWSRSRRAMLLIKPSANDDALPTRDEAVSAPFFLLSYFLFLSLRSNRPPRRGIEPRAGNHPRASIDPTFPSIDRSLFAEKESIEIFLFVPSIY